jgi:hypothetical protein
MMSRDHSSKSLVSTASAPPVVWFQLVDSADGLPFRGRTADSVPRTSVSVVGQLRDVVKAKYEYLKDVLSGSLVVYSDRVAFDQRNAEDGKQEPMEEDSLIDGFGASKTEALIFVVPSSGISSARTVDSSLGGKEPHPKRKQRWIELNKILEGNTQKAAKTSSSADFPSLHASEYNFSGKEPDPRRKQRWIKLNKIVAGIAERSETSVTGRFPNVNWNHVNTIFTPKRYVQQQRNMNKDRLDVLAEYLSHATKVFRTVMNDAIIHYMISPVLVCVSNLFDGHVEIVVDGDVEGRFIRAHSHLNFILRRKDKAVYVVATKKDNFEQGMADVLIACEIAAEVHGLNIVHGIVTNYVQWNFLRSLDDKVEMEECSFSLTPNGPRRDSLCKIAEKIYAMLSDDN